MFETWKERRALERELREIDARYRSIPALSEQEQEELKGSLDWERKHVEHELLRLQSRKLIRTARRLGIDVNLVVPKGEEWWIRVSHRMKYLNYAGTVKLTRLIADRRYELAKKWTDLLAPISSTVISIVALIVAILALYLQTLSDPIIIVPPPK